MIRIILKESVDYEKMNEVLKGYGVTDNVFITEAINQEWLDGINNDKDHPLKHLKPEDRDLTMEELKSLFPTWTKEGTLEYHFSSETDEEEIPKYAKFIVENKESIQFLNYGEKLIERGEVPEEYHSVILSLEEPETEPEMLSEEEQYRPDLEYGLMLCKSWGLDPFYVVFGNVDRPRFMKERIYKEDIYNNLYRNSQGYGFMLLPLYNFSEGFAEKVFNEAWSIGLREEPHFFMSYIYNFDFENFREVAKKLEEFYSAEELKERFELAFNKLKMDLSVAGYRNFTFERGQFKVKNVKKDSISTNKLNLLNALLYSLKGKKGKSINFNPISYLSQLETV